MKVCDKCMKRKVEKIIKLGDKEVELCSICFNYIVEWLEKPESKSIFSLLGGKS